MSSRIKVESSRIERQDGQSTAQASVIKDSDTCMPTLRCQVARGIGERLMKESDYQLTDYGSRVQRVLIKSAARTLQSCPTEASLLDATEGHIDDAAYLDLPDVLEHVGSNSDRAAARKLGQLVGRATTPSSERRRWALAGLSSL